MSESTEPTTDNVTPAETTDVGDAQLDAVLEATQRRQTIVEVAAAKLGVGKTKVCDLLRNVWKTSKDQPELTDQELFQGMSLIARFELDPITREIYVTRDNKDRLLTIIGIDGWIKILDRTPGYDGFEQECEFDEDGVKYTAVTTKIYSRIRTHPVTYVARRSEWGGMGGRMWGPLYNHMLVVLSIRHAARLFAAIGGNVVTECEADWMTADEPPHHDNPAPSPDAPKVQPRGERVTQVDCVALRESWDAYRDQQGLPATPKAFGQFVEGATGMERGNVFDVSSWTRADIDKCDTAIAMEAPEEPPEET